MVVDQWTSMGISVISDDDWWHTDSVDDASDDTDLFLPSTPAGCGVVDQWTSVRISVISDVEGAVSSA